MLLELFQRSADLACVVDPEGYLKWVSPSWTRLLGWTEAELLSKPFAHFLHPADVDRTIEVVASTFEGRDLIGFENRYRTRDGTYVRVEWSAIGQAGDPPLIFVIGRDVSRLHASQLLLEERSRMMDLAEGLMGVGRWWIDLHTNQTVWTPTIYEIYGLDPAGPPPDVEYGIQAYHPDDQELVASEVGRVAEEGGRFSFRARIMRPDGSIRHVQAAGMAEADEDGTVHTVFGVFRDISEELEMQRLLRHAERMASLGTVAAGVAHEINNPLTWLSGSLEVLREQLANLTPDTLLDEREDLLDLTRTALDGGARIAKIVKGLRAFSHEGGARDVVRLEDVVDTAVAVAEHELRHHAVLERDIDPSLTVLGDQTQLGQVLVNLLVNASQSFGSEKSGEGTIRLTAERHDDGGSVIRVEDSGSGIPEADLHRVWDPFFTTKPVGVGSGLGLPIVHGLVDQHGGTIELESVEGEGTTVTVRFPPAPSTVEASDRVRPEVPVSRPDDAAARAPTVLVVDDEPAILDLIARCVRGTFEVETAQSGRDAIRLLGARADIEVVCCDVMMPEISGMEVWAWIAEHRPALLERTIMISGGAFTEEAHAFIAEHAPPLLEKPFTVETIRRTLLELAPD